MILCSSAPLSIIKAALLAQLCGELPCLTTERSRFGLFSHAELRSADPENLEELIQRLAQQQNLAAHWLQEKEGRSLARLIVANLRYHSPDRGSVIFAALEEALRRGPNHCLLGIGELSRVFVNRAKSVLHEVHRMTGFIRFHPAPDNTLIAQPKLFHETADWLIRQLARRYPDSRLILLVENQALVFSDGHLTITTDIAPFQLHIANRDFDMIWETYYRSQYIEARRNDQQANRLIPRKYRNWMVEGSILNSESDPRHS